MNHVSSLSDDEVWNDDIPPGLDKSLWSFVFLTILWRLWDSRNGEVFRNEISHHRTILSRVCDDLVIWCKRLPYELVNSLGGWCDYLRDRLPVTLALSRLLECFCSLE
jgi:hypothetical protein